MTVLLKMLDSAGLGALLEGIEKPGRYIGHEFGIKSKKLDNLLKNPEIVNVALAFPDVYEVGMSNLGLQILYKIINENPQFNAERVFCPWFDFEASLRNSNTKLFSLENRIFLDCFELIGFNAAHEMLYTNILNTIDLSKLRLRAADRSEIFPLICCGGSSTVNPWPLSAFMDFMVIGDGEKVITEILNIIKIYKIKILKQKNDRAKDVLKNVKPARADNFTYFSMTEEALMKNEILGALSEVEGVFVPAFYNISYNSDNTVKKIGYCPSSAEKNEYEIFAADKKSINKTVKKAVIKDLDSFDVLTDPVIPNISTVHDRLNIEIMRGCPRGCRFCQAGFIYRPVRQRKVENLIKKSSEALSNTGYDEISFTSLSSSDYKNLETLIEGVTGSSLFEKISISLPSLRLDSFNFKIAQVIQSGRKTGLTFAPEAGSQRLRDIIKKDIRKEDLIKSVETAFLGGWSRVKLYFMIGLPFENEQDVRAVTETITEVISVARNTLTKRNFGRFQLSVSINAFTPKPFTPFQWAAQEKIEELEKKIKLVREGISSRFVQLHWTGPQKSRIECAFSRGDSKLSDVLEIAWKNGAKFDNWSDYFDYNLWLKSFEDAGVDPDFYTSRQYGLNEVLPWDVIDTGIKKSFFIDEYKKAFGFK